MDDSTFAPKKSLKTEINGQIWNVWNKVIYLTFARSIIWNSAKILRDTSNKGTITNNKRYESNGNTTSG